MVRVVSIVLEVSKQLYVKFVSGSRSRMVLNPDPDLDLDLIWICYSRPFTSSWKVSGLKRSTTSERRM